MECVKCKNMVCGWGRESVQWVEVLQRLGNIQEMSGNFTLLGQWSHREYNFIKVWKQK